MFELLTLLEHTMALKFGFCVPDGHKLPLGKSFISAAKRRRMERFTMPLRVKIQMQKVLLGETLLLSL
jgi:hypothetical protein